MNPSLTDVLFMKSSDDFELKAGDNGEPTGELEAIFSKLGVEDRDGDIIAEGAIKSGTQVPLVWHHQWSRPVGKGKIEIDGNLAIFKGKFFLDTADGLEAFKTVKNMGRLQQWSWGFRIVEAEPKSADVDPEEDPWWWLDGMKVTKTEPFEVSPVLVGANKHTRTVSIKGTNYFLPPDRADRLEILSAATTNLPTPPTKGMRLSDEGEAVLAATSAFLGRVKALAALREGDGRDLSPAHIERLAKCLGNLRELATEVEALVEKHGSELSDPAPAQDDTVEAAARMRERRFELARRQAALWEV